MTRIREGGMPLAVAAGAVVLAAVVVWRSARGVVEAVLVPTGQQASAVERERDEQAGRYSEALERALAQFEGRSLFFVPSPPPPPRREEPVIVDLPPPPPPPPATYGGPAPVAMIDGTAWFADGTRLRPGDGARGDLEVVALDPPWSVRVRWKGVEFTVRLFERDSVVIRTTPASGGSAAGPDRGQVEARTGSADSEAGGPVDGPASTSGSQP